MFKKRLHRKKKLDVIAHSLTSSGIPIWEGMPELIVEDLKKNGYVIKKKKDKK
jgi:hypothetical protein